MIRPDFHDPLPIRRRLLHALQEAFGRTALPDRFARDRNLRGAVVLMYHSVADPVRARWIDPGNHLCPEIFRRHAEFLARNRNVISMSELVDGLMEGQTFPAGTVVLTFDDGYLDNADTAFPILAELELPATLFLPTSYIDSAETQWIDRLYGSFVDRSFDELEVEVPECSPQRFDLAERTARAAAYRQLSAYLLTATWLQRNELLKRIEEQIRPRSEIPRLTMGWSEVRKIAREYPLMELGSHTMTHMDVTAFSEEEVQPEIEDSKRRIETESDLPVRFFSFPYNRVAPTVMQRLGRAGYDAAVADGDDIRITSESPRFALPRIEAPASIGRLALVTSGAYPELSVALLRRA